MNLLLKSQCQEYFSVCAKVMGPNENFTEETTDLHIYQKRLYTSLGSSYSQYVRQILLLSACMHLCMSREQ